MKIFKAKYRIVQTQNGMFLIQRKTFFKWKYYWASKNGPRWSDYLNDASLYSTLQNAKDDLNYIKSGRDIVVHEES